MRESHEQNIWENNLEVNDDLLNHLLDSGPLFKSILIQSLRVFLIKMWGKQLNDEELWTILKPQIENYRLGDLLK